MSKNYRVEFIGMPGSGKTFLQNKVIKYIKIKNYKKVTNNFKILNRWSKLIFFILFIFKKPLFALKTIVLIKTSKGMPNEKNKHLYYFFNEASLYSYFNSLNKNLIIINSEGFLYRSCFYFHPKSFLFNLENYIKEVPKVDLIVFVKSNKTLNIKRANSRKKEYNYNFDDIKTYKEKDELIDKIVNIYKNKKNCNIINLSNTKNKLNKIKIKKIVNIIKNENIAY